jgi:excinuclease ABC subunit A
VNGGRIVVEGTPEAVAAEKRSFTGQYLKPLLERSTRSPAEAGAQPAKKRRKATDADQPDLIPAK